MMKRTLCFVFALVLLLSACGRPDPGPSPTLAPEQTAAAVQTPTPDPEAEGTQDPLERALAFLRTRDKDYVQRHVGTYLELYRMSHPGADVQVTGWTTDAQGIHMNLTGLEARDFAEADYFPDLVEFSSVISGNTFVREDLPVPREPESDHLSERGMRITMDRADWPVGAEYIRFTLTNETEDYLSYNEICLQKAVEGLWHNVRLAGGSIGSAWVLEPRASVTWVMPVQFLYPRLGEGLYRVYLPHEKDWAEFAVRAEEEPMDPEPMDPEYLICRNWPEAALLLAGLPETVESDLAHVVHWPAVSHHWRLTVDRSLSDEGLAQQLLGEEAEYDAAAAVWRAGTLTLSLGDKVRVVNDSLLSKALQLALPLRGPETLDLRKIPSLEEAGWTLGGFWTELDAGIGDLYPGLNSRCFIPDIGILNERLEAALERLEDEDPRYTELADFRFAPEDAGDLRLVLISLRTVTPEVGINAWPVVSPWGELEETAVWYVSDESLGILLLEGQYPGSCLESYDSGETVSPMEQIEKFLPLMEGEEEGLRLTRMDYVLIPGHEEGLYQPAYRLLAETASGEERCFVVSAVSRGASAYDLQRRAYLEELMNAHTVTDIFETCWAQYPEMDVWPVSFGIRALEDGREALMIDCDGVDCPALEASGLLPEGVALNYPEEQFNQKEAHPCPWEPEWEKSWAGGTVTLTMAQAEYPLYPDYVELTVRCERSFNRNWDRFEKYADGEWHHVREWMAGTLGLRYVESGETALQVRTNAKLGPGLYRLYLNDEYWVEFAVSEASEENGSFDRSGVSQAETERLVQQCTHIVKAEYAGTESWDRGEMLAFVPLETWKGEIRDERIFLQAEDPVILGRQGFRKGDTVILLLNRHISVYYPHDIYTAAGGYELGALEKKQVDSILAAAPPQEKDHYGVEYTLSRDLKEILEATECVFAVEPVSVSFPDGKGTVTWLSRVRAALRGQPVYREIHIVFFPEDVEEGKEYLVLLNQVDGGTLYVLSSRNSVYPMEAAGEIPELRTLLENAGTLDAPEEPTEEEILAAEKQAAGMS